MSVVCCCVDVFSVVLVVPMAVEFCCTDVFILLLLAIVELTAIECCCIAELLLVLFSKVAVVIYVFYFCLN